MMKTPEGRTSNINEFGRRVASGVGWRRLLVTTRGSKIPKVRHRIEVNRTSNFLSNLLAHGKVKRFVEKIYRMTETVEALRYFNEGHTRGKLVISIDYP